MSKRSERRRNQRAVESKEPISSRLPGAPSDSIPAWAPWVLYPLVTLVLFREFVFSDLMLLGFDTESGGYMARAFFAERLAAGDFPLWAPRLLGGIPLVEALAAGDSIYPTSLLYFIMEPYRALGWKLVLHILAGGFFMYGWVKALGLHRGAALLAGLAWLLAPVIVTLVLPGNDGKLMVFSLAPAVFWAARRLFDDPGPRTAAWLAMAVGVTCLTTQFQTSYFLFLAVGCFAGVMLLLPPAKDGGEEGSGVSDSPRPFPKRAITFGVFLAAAVLGAATAAVQLVPAADYVTDASRRIRTTTEATPEEALAYSSSFSLHPEEVLSLVVPEFIGNGAADAEWGRQTYWGRNSLKYNHEYVGVAILLLALFALVYRPRMVRERWFFFGLGVVALLFALGQHTPVWRVFYAVVPGISLFRVPSLSAFLVSFSATTLFAFGVDDLLRGRVQGSFFQGARGKAGLLFVGGLVLLLILQVSGVLLSVWTSGIHTEMLPYQQQALANLTPHLTSGFLFAALLAAATLGVAWSWREGRVPVVAALGLLGTLLVVDLGRVDAPFIQTLDFHAWSAADNNVRTLQQLQETQPPFRVLDARGAQSVVLGMHGLDLVAGHHPNDLSRFRDLTGLEGSQATGSNLTHPNVLRMLGTQFLLWPEGQQGGPPFAGAQALSAVDYSSGREAVYAYPGLGRGWVVFESEALPEGEPTLTRLLSPEFDPGRQVVLEEGVAPNLGQPGQASVVWETFDPDARVARVRSSSPGVLVVSENWFPGWVATVDGEDAPVWRANHTLQAVQVPAGESTVELRFTAPTFVRWGKVSLLAVLVTLGLGIAPSVVSRRGKGAPNEGVQVEPAS